MSKSSSSNASGGWPSPKTNSAEPVCRIRPDRPASTWGRNSTCAWPGPSARICCSKAGWLYLIKGSYYSNLLKEGVAGAPNDKNTDYVFLSMRLFF